MEKGDDFLIINKPSGLTSHQVVEKLRPLFPGKKVGHAGTLDPLAEGILIILIGAATKQQSHFMRLPKKYFFEITFGQERDTYDAEGRIVAQAGEEALKSLDFNRVKEALVPFQGLIKQKVPPFSAVKVKGKRLYELARKGKLDQVELPIKTVRIQRLELLRFYPWSEENLPRAELEMTCSYGTYVRSLAHDLGEKLGVGGYISRIIRTAVGDFSLNEAEKLEDLLARVKESGVKSRSSS